jgi:FixJ family two-component response regulator
MQSINYNTARAIIRTAPASRPVVFVVEPDASERESVELLVDAEGWQGVALASAEAFLSRPPATSPSCLVLNAALPRFGGLELQRQVAERTSMPIILMTGSGDVATSVQAMKAGAFDVLEKPLDPGMLLAAIRDALKRSGDMQLEESELSSVRTRYASLTRREGDVMRLVVSGLLNKQVGGELGISEITVKAHRGQVMRKMKADSLPDLVTMAARLGVLSLRAH